MMKFMEGHISGLKIGQKFRFKQTPKDNHYIPEGNTFTLIAEYEVENENGERHCLVANFEVEPIAD